MPMRVHVSASVRDGDDSLIAESEQTTVVTPPLDLPCEPDEPLNPDATRRYAAGTAERSQALLDAVAADLSKQLADWWERELYEPDS